MFVSKVREKRLEMFDVFDIDVHFFDSQSDIHFQSDIISGEKKRHHHHHHKPTNGHNRNNEPRDSHLVASNARRDHRNEHY